jgi:hypothetical protein
MGVVLVGPYVTNSVRYNLLSSSSSVLEGSYSIVNGHTPAAEDCLIAAFHVDPAAYGLQTYEANYFLTRRVTIDTCVPLVLWQVGLVADHGFRRAGFDGRHFDLL